MQKEPLIINACLTGMVPKKSDNRYIPISPDEIIKDVYTVMKEGATVVHIHARDRDETPTYKKETYAKIIKGIKKNSPKAIICVSTSGRKFKSFAKRSEVLDLKGKFRPNFASLTLGSFNFPKQAVNNEPEMIKKLAKKMKKNNIFPEWEVFEPGMLHYGKYLVRKGVLKEPRWINIFLGSLGTSPATSNTLSLFLSMLKPNWRWAATGVGKFQLRINIMAMVNGGHVRVGLEDSFFMDRRKKELATNQKLIKRIVQIAKTTGRKIATLEQARKILLD